jgi:hypothetical protein
MDEIPSKLNSRDLINFSMVNRDMNSLLSKRVKEKKDKVAYDILYDHNKLINKFYNNISNSKGSQNYLFFKMCNFHCSTLLHKFQIYTIYHDICTLSSYFISSLKFPT